MRLAFSLESDLSGEAALQEGGVTRLAQIYIAKYYSYVTLIFFSTNLDYP